MQAEELERQVNAVLMKTRADWRGQKWVEGEWIFRRYCKEHGIKLDEDILWGYSDNSPHLQPDWVFDDPFPFFDISFDKAADETSHLPSPLDNIDTQDFHHYRIMRDRNLFRSDWRVVGDYISFEQRALYEVKHWMSRPSFGSLTDAQKDGFRRLVGKWECFIVWVKDDEEIELIEIKKDEILRKGSLSNGRASVNSRRRSGTAAMNTVRHF